MGMCECFKLCSDHDILNFTNYLPIITTNNSYWNDYLKIVYGSYPKLPFDVQKLETFYPGLLPTRIDRCTGYKEFAWNKNNVSKTTTQWCSPHICDKWLSATKRHAKHATVIKSISTSDKRLRMLMQSNLMSVFLVIQKSNRSNAQSNKWLEVARVGSWSGEADSYGCWFWRAKGSGVFIHTGSAMTINQVSNVHKYGFQKHDRTWGKTLMSRNITSLHILYTHPHLHHGIHQWKTTPYEIVTTHDACMNRRDVRMACVENLHLRTGWYGENLCDCHHNHSHKLFSEDTLLCADQMQRAIIKRHDGMGPPMSE